MVNISMSSLVILATSVFLDIVRKNRQTDAAENLTHATSVGTGNYVYTALDYQFRPIVKWYTGLKSR